MSARTALITGGSRGIGLASARKLLDRGCTVTITGRDADALAQAAEQLDGGDRLHTVAGKVGDSEHRARAVAETVERFGSLDVLVNNAGTNPFYGPLIEAPEAAVAKTLHINLVSPLLWTQSACQAWMSEHGGAILNVASVGGLIPSPMIGVYSVSKAALIHLTAQLALELAPAVRVNAVAPATVRTRFAGKFHEGNAQAGAEYPLGRLGEPDDVAHAIAYLCLEEAAWITGQTLVMDGGLTLTSAIDNPGA